jgi:hypothetical protein
MPVNKYFIRPCQIGFLIIVSIYVFSCKSTFKVQSEQIVKMSPGQYKSYKFVNPKNVPEANFSFSDKNKKIIFNAVAAEMKKRGFTSTQEADLIIKIEGGTSREGGNKSKNNYYDPMYSPYTSFYGNPYYGGSDPWRKDDISKKVTTIIINILDEKSKKLIWEGVGTGVLGDNTEEVESRINEAIKNIFTQFPVPDPSGKKSKK